MSSSNQPPMSDRAHFDHWLHTATGLSQMRIGFIQLFAAHCTSEELGYLRAINAARFLQLGTRMARLVEATVDIPTIRMLCFGSNATHEHIPPPLRACFEPELPFNHWKQLRAFWAPSMSVVFVRFQGDMSIERVLVHEVAHGLLNVLTNGFPYRPAISEGFARCFEYALSPKRDCSAWNGQDRGSGEKGRLLDSEHTSVRELMFFEFRDHMWEDVLSLEPFTRSAMWFNVFLRNISERRPSVKRILIELHQKDIQTPDGVYQWLQQATGMSADELERQFYLFCTKGVQPRVSPEG